MRPRQRRVANTRDEPEPAAGGEEQLEKELDELALQIVRRATRKDDAGTPVEPLNVQLNALKVAGAFYALKKKHSPEEDTEGSGWGGLLTFPRASEDTENDEEEEEELSNG